MTRDTYLVVSVLVLHVLGHEPHRVDRLLQVRLLLQLARVSEPAVKPVRVIAIIAVHCHIARVRPVRVAIVATIAVHRHLAVRRELVQLQREGGLEV